MHSMKILFVLLLLFGNFGIILSPGEDVEPLYSSLIGACKTNIRFAGTTSYLSPPSAVGSVLGFLLLLLFSTGAKVRKKNANCSRIADAIRVCWPKLLSTYTCKYGAKGSAAQLQVTVIMPSWQYVAAQLPLIKDSYSAAAALTIAFGDTCGYQHSPRALVKSPTAAVLQVSQGSLQRFWVFASSIVVPVYRTCIICLQCLCKLAASPSASSMLRLLTALRWLLIVAGDVELNPGPIPAGIAELLPTVDQSVLTEDNLFYVLEEVGSLAGKWRNMCLALGVPDVDTIASRWHDYPKDCLTDVLKQWLKKSYNTQMHGPPTWRKLVGAVANDNGGDNPALAETIAKNHQCTDPLGQPAAIDPGAQLDPRAQSKEPAMKRPRIEEPPMKRRKLDGGDRGSGGGDSGRRSTSGGTEPVKKRPKIEEPAMKQPKIEGGGEGGTHSGYGGGDGSGGSNGGVSSGGTAVYSTLQRKSDKIIRALADQGFTRELAEKLLGAEMITRRIYDEAKNSAPGVVEMDRTTVLFNAVLASVELNPARCGTFINVLREIRGSDDLVAFIEGTAKTENSGAPSTDHFSGTSSVIKSHAEYLRGMYQTEIPMFLSLQWPPPPTRKVLRLAMIQGQNIDYGSREEIIRLTLHGKVNDIVHKKTPVKLEDIFRIDKVARKAILIEGAPGSGKSTLAWYICQQWQASKLFREFETVVFVQLRDPAIHSAKALEDLFPAGSKSQAVAVVAELQAKQGQGMLWVMDGWDELPVHLRTNSIFHGLISSPRALNLHFSAVVVTSRPVASGDLYRFISSRVEILGFTPTEVKEYFTEALGRDVQLVQKLQNCLKEQPMLEASCYIPINAAIITHLFLAQSQRLPTTLHGVFTSLVICCLIRHMTKKNGECHISSLDSLPSCLKEPFYKICALAYHGVMENKATFSAKDLEQLRLPQELETLGLIQGVKSFASFQKSVSYNFLHLSVQELLASFHISKLLGNEEIDVFKRLFGQPRFAAVFQFYAAFTKLKTLGIREIVANIVKKKEKSQILYLIHGLYEARDVSLCQFVISQLSGELVFSDNSLSPVDCLCIGYFLCCVCQTTEGKFVVDLSWCSLDYNRVHFLVKEFSKSSNAMETTGAGVPSCTELHLNLTGNAVGGDGAALLCAALNGNHSLKTLDLYGNAVGDDGAALLCAALNGNCSLKTLDLGNNNIGKTGAVSIIKLLRQNKTLEHLQLYSNEITDAGAQDLSEALKVNQNLRELNLAQIRISDEGAKALRAALRVNQSLTRLWLGLNRGISAEMKASMQEEFSGRVFF